MKYIILLLLISTNNNHYIKTENGLLSKDFGWCVNGLLYNNQWLQVFNDDLDQMRCGGYVSLTLEEYRQATKCDPIRNHNTVYGSCKR